MDAVWYLSAFVPFPDVEELCVSSHTVHRIEFHFHLLWYSYDEL